VLQTPAREAQACWADPAKVSGKRHRECLAKPLHSIAALHRNHLHLAERPYFPPELVAVSRLTATRDLWLFGLETGYLMLLSLTPSWEQ